MSYTMDGNDPVFKVDSVPGKRQYTAPHCFARRARTGTTLSGSLWCPQSPEPGDARAPVHAKAWATWRLQSRAHQEGGARFSVHRNFSSSPVLRLRGIAAIGRPGDCAALTLRDGVNFFLAELWHERAALNLGGWRSCARSKASAMGKLRCRAGRSRTLGSRALRKWGGPPGTGELKLLCPLKRAPPGAGCWLEKVARASARKEALASQPGAAGSRTSRESPGWWSTRCGAGPSWACTICGPG